MGAIDRIWQVIRANFNSLIERAEDPEKILEQTISTMQSDLMQLRMAVAQAIATQKRTERQYSQAQSTVDDWYHRAQFALQKGDEDLARQALTKRKFYQETAEVMQSHLVQQKAIASRLRDDMKMLEQKIIEARQKKDLYMARARSAEASIRINQMLGNMTSGSSLNALERMEEKVIQLEAQVEAISLMPTDELEKKFISLQEANEIDAELLAMKAELNIGTPSAQLPPSQIPVVKPASEPQLE